MARKLQSFFVLKFTSDRLKDDNYNIEIDLDQARMDGEVIRLGDSELLRAIRRIKGVEFSPEELVRLEKEKKHLKNKPDSPEVRSKLKYIERKIDQILYVPELVNVTFSDSRHYKKILEAGGLTINGKKYHRLLAGAGMTRRSTVMFCSEEILEKIRKFLNNGRKEGYKINPSKWNAYYALASSATIPVSMPRFCVIPDLNVDRPVRVDMMTENEEGIDPTIEEKEIINTFNLFDGQGLISPELSAQWSNEVELDWIPSAWIFRGAYLKGLLVTFDFHALAEDRKITTIKDIYGNIHDIFDIDAIISESQFKLWSAYNSIQDYVDICKQNKFGWGISRYSPKVEKKHAITTYQYIQNLNITTDEQIEGVCAKTVDWFSKVSGEDWASSVLYLMGEVEKEEIDADWFNSLTDNVLKTLLIEPKLIKEKFIRQHIIRMLNRKINDSYMGGLLVNGNYQFMISDPYAQAQHALGLKATGLLGEGEHYSQYWNKRGAEKISAVRSPMTWRSENNVMQLVRSNDMDFWYQYLYSGIVFNIYGADAMSMSGADFDGDICMSTDQKEFVEGRFPNVAPPTYERKSASKKIVCEDELWEYDCKTFRSKIGLVTNIGTNFFAMLPLYDEGSKEYKAIVDRIKVCNCLQSMEIDKAKGIQTMPMPKWWTSWTKIKDDMTEEEIERANFNNSILCSKRPYFFRYLYSSKNKDYQTHMKTMSRYSYAYFRMYLNDLLKLPQRTEFQSKVIKHHLEKTPLLDSECILNKVSHYMENQVKEIKCQSRNTKIDLDGILDDIIINKNDLIKMKELYSKYRKYKFGPEENADETSFIHSLSSSAYSINSNIKYIIKLALLTNAKFAFYVFGNDIVNVLLEKNWNVINIPIPDEYGDIEYLGEKYKATRFVLGEEK